MRHIQSLKQIREVLLNARHKLVEEMMKDIDSPIHWLDHTPEILREIDAAIKECDSYDINKR